MSSGRDVSGRCWRDRVRGVAVAALTLLAATGAVAQEPLTEANQRIDAGWQALRDGEWFERNGDTGRGIAAYAVAAQQAATALRIGDAVGVPFEHRPAGLYFLLGQAELHRAEALLRSGVAPELVGPVLFQAHHALVDTLRLVDLRQPRDSPAWAEMRGGALFALGRVYMLDGDFATAGRIMREVEALRPGLAPAREARAQIDSVLPGESRAGEAGRERLVAYAVEFGKALFGRWGTIAGMLIEDVFGGSR